MIREFPAITVNTEGANGSAQGVAVGSEYVAGYLNAVALTYHASAPVTTVVRVKETGGAGRTLLEVTGNTNRVLFPRSDRHDLLGAAIDGKDTLCLAGRLLTVEVDDCDELDGAVTALPLVTRRPGRAPIASVSSTPAPVIDTEAIVGVALDAGEGYASYQWQSSSDGATWADIEGETNQTYTPVDADFGLFLRVVPNGNVSLASNATERVAELPEQTLGVELVTNGNMETGNPPTDWTIGAEITLSAEAERDGGSGAQSLGITRSSAGGSGRAYQTVTTVVGSYYEFSGWRRNVNATGVAFYTGGGLTSLAPYSPSTSWNMARNFIRAINTTTLIEAYLNASIGQSVQVDDISLRLVTTNAQLTAPSADMRLTQFYTLPASPVRGSQLWLASRVPDNEDFFEDGDGWLILLEYTGSQWNITLFSVSSHSRTSRIAATNIGATVGLRVNANGDNWTLETTADGETWTVHGGGASNSAYNTATGVNVLHTSDFTVGNLVYEPAV